MRHSFVAISAFIVSGALIVVGGSIARLDSEISTVRRPAHAAVAAAPGNARAVSFATRDGVMLHGSFAPSRNGVTVVLAHGHGATRAQMYPEMVFFEDHGFGVLAFDWRGHGESSGESSTRGSQERLDLIAALDFLGREPGVDARRIGVVGFSRGGSVAIEVAARDPRISAVVAEAASVSLITALKRDIGWPRYVPDWPLRWAARRAGLDVAFAPIETVARISPRPVLIIQGTRDDSVPVSDALSLYEAAGEPRQLWLVEGAAHGDYIAVAPFEYRATLLPFFHSLVSQ